jgi:tRNA dimethylallyltransferase
MSPVTTEPAAALLLLGPTACGKSALASNLATEQASEVRVEIVSIDSAQVYRGMDIGTAKPDAAERARIRHHLLDLREPDQPYSAADFVRDATAAIADIRRQDALPLVVGGTMLYARALRSGLSNLPSADAAEREALEQEAREHGWPALHRQLAAADPVSAARISPNDSQRIQRALEVLRLTGTPLSQLQTGGHAPPLKLATIALLPADRGQLHRRIEQRFDAMLAAGLLDEARALQGFDPDLPALRSVGYRQALSHLRGECSHAEFRDAAIAATRRLAKRQMTWLRSMTDATVIDPFAAGALARVREVIAELG